MTVAETLWTPDQLAERLNVSRKRAWQMLHRGELPGRVRVGRLWRVRPDAVEEFIREGGVEQK